MPFIDGTKHDRRRDVGRRQRPRYQGTEQGEGGALATRWGSARYAKNRRHVECVMDVSKQNPQGYNDVGTGRQHNVGLCGGGDPGEQLASIYGLVPRVRVFEERPTILFRATILAA